MEQKILHSKIYGEGLPGTSLLVFHGLFGMLDNWASFGKEIGQVRPVHLIDLRNHGKSFHSDEMSLDDMAHDILHYMQFYQLEKAILLGHSLGGKAVMQFAVKYPLKVEKLIVVDIAPKSYPPHHQGIFKALESVDFNVVNTRHDVAEILSQYIPEISVVQFLEKNLYWTEDKKLNWRFNLSALAKSYNGIVSNPIKFGMYSGETLFISGAKSNYILPQDDFLIKQEFPHSKIISIANAGHWVQAENPKDFTSAVREFLD